MKIKKRVEYKSNNNFFTSIKDLNNTSPFNLFKKFFSIADKNVKEANQMVLSTVSRDLIPSSRVVLLKDFDNKKFTFYTNYLSQKGKEINQNPQVALNFYWEEIKIQIRIIGKARKTSLKKSKKYFFSRPWKSQLGTILSKQSQELNNYQEFLKKFNQKKKKKKLFMPENWGGYEIYPYYFEFWRGNINRLHERISFEKKKKWLFFRLQP